MAFHAGAVGWLVIGGMADDDPVQSKGGAYLNQGIGVRFISVSGLASVDDSPMPVESGVGDAIASDLPSNDELKESKLTPVLEVLPVTEERSMDTKVGENVVEEKGARLHVGSPHLVVDTATQSMHPKSDSITTKAVSKALEPKRVLTPMEQPDAQPNTIPSKNRDLAAVPVATAPIATAPIASALIVAVTPNDNDDVQRSSLSVSDMTSAKAATSAPTESLSEQLSEKRPEQLIGQSVGRPNDYLSGRLGEADTANQIEPPAYTQTFIEYPARARKRGQEGLVEVKVLVSAAGKVKQVALVQSSNHVLLDKAALKAVRRWRFKPAIKESQAIEASVIVPYEFKLQ